MGRSETTPRAHVSRHHLQVHWKLTPPYIHPHSRPCPHSIVHKQFPNPRGNTSRSRQIAKTARWCSPHYGLDRTKSSPRITCEHVPLHTWRTSLHPWSRTRPRRKSLIRAFSSVFIYIYKYMYIYKLMIYNYILFVCLVYIMSIYACTGKYLEPMHVLSPLCSLFRTLKPFSIKGPSVDIWILLFIFKVSQNS